MKNSNIFSETLSRGRLLAMFLVTIILGGLPMACDHSDLWSEMPGEVAEFINKYYPMSELQSYSHEGSTYHVRIDNGPGLTFNEDCAWIAIDGYGMPLPQMLLFDQLPPRLYNYIQEMEELNGVFSISRDGDVYYANLLDTTVKYNVKTDALDGVVTPSGSASKN